MKISVLHDYADVFRSTRAFSRLKDHEVAIHTEAYTDPARVVEQAAGCEALLLTQQRVPLTRQIIEQLPELRFISQTGRNTYHLDLSACTQQGIVVSAGGGGGGGSPYFHHCRADLGPDSRGHPINVANPEAVGKR